MPHMSSIMLLFLFVFFYSLSVLLVCFFFFFNDTATTEIYTLSLHDALPIYIMFAVISSSERNTSWRSRDSRKKARSEEHTSELQSPCNLVCRLLLEKKKKKKIKMQVCVRVLQDDDVVSERCRDYVTEQVQSV